MKCPTCGNPKMTAAVEPYRYDESGLPNIVLHGIKVHRCDRCGEQAALIPAMAELHRVLALCLVQKPWRLSPAEFKFLRKYLGYSGTDFAKLLGMRKETMSRWETGAQAISALADRFVRLAVVQDKRVENYPVKQLADIQDEPKGPQTPVWLSRKDNHWTPEAQSCA